MPGWRTARREVISHREAVSGFSVLNGQPFAFDFHTIPRSLGGSVGRLKFQTKEWIRQECPDLTVPRIQNPKSPPTAEFETIHMPPRNYQYLIQEWRLDWPSFPRCDAEHSIRLIVPAAGSVGSELANCPKIAFRDVRCRFALAPEDDDNSLYSGYGFFQDSPPRFDEEIVILVQQLSTRPVRIPTFTDEVDSSSSIDSKEFAEASKRAEELLLSFLDSEQKKTYKEKNFFKYKEIPQLRLWTFYNRFHYPVVVKDARWNFYNLCIQLDDKTPTEDILLMAYLEVKGGRGDKLLTLNPRIERFMPMPDLSVPAQRCIDVAQTFSNQVRSTNEHSRDFAEAYRLSRRIYQESLGAPRESISSEEQRITGTVARSNNNVAPPLTLEALTGVMRSLRQNGGRVRRISCSPAFISRLQRDVAPRGEEQSQIGMFAEIFGIEVFVNQSQTEPWILI